MNWEQHLVNAQTEVNRAEFEMNLPGEPLDSPSYKEEPDLIYIEKRMQSAVESLEKGLKDMGKTGNTNKQLDDMAHAIALDSAVSDIKSACVQERVDGKLWYRTSGAHPLCAAYVDRAANYLELRGGLQRHPDRPAFVRFQGMIR